MTDTITITDPEQAATFEEFWPFYLSQHMESGTRIVHVVGTTLAIVTLLRGILGRKLKRILLAPVVGYAFAWAAHFGIEKNKPATFGNPAWSLQGDLRLLVRTLNGSIHDDVAKVRAALEAVGTDAAADAREPQAAADGAAAVA